MPILYFRNSKGKFQVVPAIIGYSAYQIAVENGFEGTEAEWLESLKPKRGVDYWTEADKQEIIDAVLAQLGGSGDTTEPSYTTKIMLMHGDNDTVTTVFEESAVGHSPKVRMTIYADKLRFTGETTENTYTLPDDSTGIAGLSYLMNQSTPDDGWEVGSTQIIGGTEGQNTEIMRFPVYSDSSSSGDSSGDSASSGDSSGGSSGGSSADEPTYTTYITLNPQFAYAYTSPATSPNCPVLTVKVTETGFEVYADETIVSRWTYEGDYTFEGVSTDDISAGIGTKTYAPGTSFTIGGVAYNYGIELYAHTTVDVSTYTIPAGIYECAETPTMPTAQVYGTLDFTGGENSYSSMEADPNYIYYDEEEVYEDHIGWSEEDELKRTITINEDGKVSKEFYDWFMENYSEKIYTTKIMLMHGDDDTVTTVFEETAFGHSPKVRMSIYSGGFQFTGESTEVSYTLPADSTGIIGLSCEPNHDEPDDGWAVGDEQIIGGEEGQDTEIMRFPVY